ncbi:MAG: MmcQ/YjbR family DNA-binding protein [Acidimicrobiales bacterium]|nr:hypothetical protein [Actinomycetota bacterium]
MRWKAVCKLGRQLPEVVEGETYGVPALSVRGSLVARLLPDKKSIAVKVGLDERAALCASRPETFVVTPEFQNYSMMIVRLTTIGDGEMWPILVDSWRRSAPPRLAAEFEARRTPGDY